MTIERVLVTGSSGTIGTALASQLLNQGYVVYCADIKPNRWISEVDERTKITDLRNPDEVSELCSDVDLIVHLGAHARVQNSVKEPKLMANNLEMTFNVLEHARRSDIPHFLFASSREVYGDGNQTVFRENETSIDETKSPYTASKVGGESMVHSYRECYGLSTCIARFSNVYGRYDDSDRVIPLFIARSDRGRPLTVFGSEKILDFTYIDDCIDGITGIIDKFRRVNGCVLNISSGRGTSLIELAHEINNRTPSESEIRIEPSRQGEVRKYISDVSKAEKIIDYRPQYSLTDGLERTIDWYLDHPSLLDQIYRSSLDSE